jgi:hypothetical protein
VAKSRFGLGGDSIPSSADTCPALARGSRLDCTFAYKVISHLSPFRHERGPLASAGHVSADEGIMPTGPLQHVSALRRCITQTSDRDLCKHICFQGIFDQLLSIA